MINTHGTLIDLHRAGKRVARIQGNRAAAGFDQTAAAADDRLHLRDAVSRERQVFAIGVDVSKKVEADRPVSGDNGLVGIKFDWNVKRNGRSGVGRINACVQRD